MSAKIALIICLAVLCVACKTMKSASKSMGASLDKSMVYLLEERDVFQPQTTPVRPETFNRRNIEVALPDGNILRGIAITRIGARANMLYFCGNAEMAQAMTLEMTKWAERYNVNAICVDYRGYGASSGVPAVKHLADDALRVYDQTSETRRGLPTIVIGYAIGSLPATFVAASRQCSGLVLIAPITSFEDQDMYPRDHTRRLVPLYHKPFSGRATMKPAFEIPAQIEPIYQIPNVAAPLLVIHGEDDTEIPSVCGMKIYSLAKGKKTLLLLQGMRHGEISLVEGPSGEGMAKFMDECLGPQTAPDEEKEH